MADEVQTPLITKDKRDMTVASELFEKKFQKYKTFGWRRLSYR